MTGWGRHAVQPNKLAHNDTVVSALAHAVSSGGASLSSVPGLVKRVIREECWRERLVSVLGREARFGAFTEFVTATPPEGLGTDVGTVKRLCADDAVALDLIDKAEKSAARQGARTDIYNNVQEVSSAPVGNSAQAAIRRLRKDRPDLHARVLAGEITPHGAMVLAGFRPRTFTVRADPQSAALTLARHFSPDDLLTLIHALAPVMPAED